MDIDEDAIIKISSPLVRNQENEYKNRKSPRWSITLSQTSADLVLAILKCRPKEKSASRVISDIVEKYGPIALEKKRKRN